MDYSLEANKEVSIALRYLAKAINSLLKDSLRGGEIEINCEKTEWLLVIIKKINEKFELTEDAIEKEDD